MKRSFLLLFLSFATTAFAQDPATAPRELRVGPGEAFAKPSDAARAARDGDTVVIEAGEWKGDVCVWRANDLTILGAGADATVLDAEGRAAAGKGLWVVQGTNVAIRGVTLRGAACPDRNGAGIRHEADGALTVTDCRSSYLVDCPNGGRVRIAGCRFVQSPVAPNGTMVSVGEEGGLHPGSVLDQRDNRFENRRANGTEIRSLVPLATP